MNISFSEKIGNIGGVTLIEKTMEKYILKNIEYIKNVMGSLPEDEVIRFTKEYGFSMFNNNVCVNAKGKNRFLYNGIAGLGLIYGFGNSGDSVKEIIKTYFIEEQLNKKFYPLSEGYPGDIIFYSLERETFGKIYYWHHESKIGNDTLLIADTFDEFLEGLYVSESVISDDDLEEEWFADDF